MPSEKEPATTVSLDLDWASIDEPTVMFANVFLVQRTNHEFIVTFGSARPPVLKKVASPEEVERLLRDRKVPIKQIVTLGIPFGRIAELVDLLQKNLQQHLQDQQQAEGSVKH